MMGGAIFQKIAQKCTFLSKYFLLYSILLLFFLLNRAFLKYHRQMRQKVIRTKISDKLGPIL
jgi:hypothetical protein